MNDTKENLKRVVVVGASCVGKTTFAKELSRIIGAKHIEMDQINWLPNWEQRTTEDLREITDAETKADTWVLDGNYTRAKDIFWARATHVVWLNYSFPIVAYRTVTRTIRRVVTGEKICGGNHETFRLTFMSKDSMILWALRTYHSRRRRYKEEVENSQYKNIEFLVFTHTKEADEFLKEVDSSLAEKS